MVWLLNHHINTKPGSKDFTDSHAQPQEGGGQVPLALEPGIGPVPHAQLPESSCYVQVQVSRPKATLFFDAHTPTHPGAFAGFGKAGQRGGVTRQMGTTAARRLFGIATHGLDNTPFLSVVYPDPVFGCTSTRQRGRGQCDNAEAEIRAEYLPCPWWLRLRTLPAMPFRATLSVQITGGQGT